MVFRRFKELVFLNFEMGAAFRIGVAFLALGIMIVGSLMAVHLPQLYIYPKENCRMVYTTVAGGRTPVWIRKCATVWITTVKGNAFVGAVGIFFFAWGGPMLLLLMGKHYLARLKKLIG